jgi:hypothetical protein
MSLAGVFALIAGMLLDVLDENKNPQTPTKGANPCGSY